MSDPEANAPRSTVIAEARGEVQAGLAALQGLSDLLRSRRVGVKALSRALPEMGAGLAGVERAVVALFAAIEPPLDHATNVVARLRFLLSSLRTELAAVSNLDARRRIGLERDATAARRELEAALCAGELAAAIDSRRTLALELGDLLRHRWKEPLRSGDAQTEVEVAIEEEASFMGDPKIALALLELAISSVRAAGVSAPRVTAKPRADGRLVVRVEARDERAAGLVVMLVPARSCYPEMLMVALEAAGRAGIEVERDASGRAFTITF